MFSSQGIPYGRVTRFHRCSLTQLKGLIDRPLTSEYVSLKKIDKLLFHASSKSKPISTKKPLNNNTSTRKLSKNTCRESTSRKNLKPQKKSSMLDSKEMISRCEKMDGFVPYEKQNNYTTEPLLVNRQEQ